MECAVLSDPRNAALILRLHFHDCFVQGCDGSVLLDDTITLQGEKKAPNNINALKGFRIIDRIKTGLSPSALKQSLVLIFSLLLLEMQFFLYLSKSESDIMVSWFFVLTSCAYAGWWTLLGCSPGRKDSKTAGYALTETNLPTADEGLLSIISKFLYQGLSVTDMVALSLEQLIKILKKNVLLAGAHTIGMARCVNFRNRIYGDFVATSGFNNPLSQQYLSNLKSVCPPVKGSDNNESAMDYVSPNLFDNSYYQILLRGEGLINSDQELYSSILAIETKKLVAKYAENPIAFFEQFSESMGENGKHHKP
ncbi:UNVERIFIED_CONTAM: Peroxidase 11 [Sesamum radiatum]|uniref:Peroxidase n=1 Tax=Sesamum radiatum TaxID=300843 RepID=A0AAW2VKQ5_SESRA